MLTGKQHKIYTYIDEEVTRKGFAPTLKEIAKHFKLSSTATAHEHVASLEEKGYLRRSKGRARALELVPIELPLQKLTIPGLLSPAPKRAPLTKNLNRTYLGDVFDLLAELPDESVDMVFGDPDYNVGIKYNNNSYTTNFENYIAWYIALAQESMRILKKDGNFFMMNYPKQNAHLRVHYLDKKFPLVSEYAWVYNTNVGHTPQRFTTAHRSILHVRKQEKNKFFKDQVALPYKNPNDRRIKENLKNGSAGRMPYSWFEFNLVKNVSKEKTDHACQIPQKLTEMLIRATTRERDKVLVLFGGSGAELEICKNLRRDFLSAEIDPKYHAMIEDRLQSGAIHEKYKLKNGKRLARGDDFREYL